MHTREINELRNKLLKRCSYIRDVLKSKSYELIDATGPIIAIIIGDEAEALQKAANLKSKGFLVPAIRPPTVPVGTSRLRLTVSALHSEEQIHALLEAFD
jgi:7-keto-8-aminopelargonate synthetase-like enzyme